MTLPQTVSALSTDDLRVRLDGAHIAVVTISRPPANYFDAPLLEAIGGIYRALEQLGDIRCIVLRSEGRHFCAGADFTGASTAEAVSADEGATRLYAAGSALFATAIPVVAAVQGAAVGGGLGLALTADFRVAETGSRFIANFARLGFHQGFGLSVTLPRLVGDQFASDMLLTGRTVGAEEAFRAGLCDRLVEPADLPRAALDLAEQIASSAPLAVRSIRQTLRGDLAARVSAVVDHERSEQARLRETRDFAEGVSASRERRDPHFEGK